MAAQYRRILLKLSGEALMGDAAYGIDPAVTERVAREIREVHELGVQIGIVIGGGNIWRGLGAASKGMDRATADYMGMLATVLNGLSLQDALEKQQVETRVMSAITIDEVAEPYVRRHALRLINEGCVVILVAGTGNPYFTTDTAAALRALELDVDILLMAKNQVDGIYSADPRVDETAERYTQISHHHVIERDLKVMDAAALALCRDRNLPLRVFDGTQEGALRRILDGEQIGTLVSSPLATAPHA